MLSFLLVPVLLGLSMLAQRPVARRLGVREAFWPLAPMPASVSLRTQALVRGSGALFTFALVVLAAFAQRVREQELTARVDVAPGLAAAEAGLLTGDVVREVDGRAVGSFGELRDGIAGASQVRLTVERDGARLEKVVTLREGVLGVKAAGEQQPISVLAALRDSVTLPVRLPATLVRAMTLAPAADAPRAAVSLQSPRFTVWVLIPLVLSWWGALVLEALGLLVARLIRAR
ncbi:MAG: PDZ domain-containing protein [Myxococcota bacterium]